MLRIALATALGIGLLAMAPESRAAGPAPAGAPEEGESPSRLRDLGNEAMLAMRYSDALELYRRASLLAPEQAGLHYSMARAYQFLGEYPKALAELEVFARTASREEMAKVAGIDAVFADVRPRVSTLDLRCNVGGARVLLRDKVIGTTPLTGVRVPAGAATLEIELDGFFTERRDVVFPGAGRLAIEVELHRKSTSALLSILTEPLGAQIFVDRRLRGSSNPRVEIALEAGPHEIVARREGYDEAHVPVVLAPGATRELPIPLDKTVPITAKWWFWTGVGAVVAGGVVTAIALTTERAPGHGTLSPSQIGVP
jgi:hypothetical protein